MGMQNVMYEMLNNTMERNNANFLLILAFKAKAIELLFTPLRSAYVNDKFVSPIQTTHCAKF